MMGQLPAAQNELFYDFCLERHIPANHLLRRINAIIDLGAFRQHLESYYSTHGRPSIDPELMIRMLIVGYCYGIRSERRLCEEVHLNLAYRWFCRLGLEHEVPDHSTFSKNRHGRFRESGALRFLFDEVVRRGMAGGLVKGEGFAVDASTIKADANRQRGVPGEVPVDWTDPQRSTRAVREYLAALDEGAATPTTPKNISLTDPMAPWTGAHGGRAFFAYSTNYLIDTHCGMILDVEATPANRTAEVDATKMMIERVAERFDLVPERLIGDTAYGSAPMLAWLVDEKGIAPHVSVWEKAERTDGTFSRSDFTWNEQGNHYRCPAGKLLHPKRRIYKSPPTGDTKVDTIKYRASVFDCRPCPLKAQCCPNMPARNVPRNIHEAARDVARLIAKTPLFQQSRRERKKVEMLFAHLKRILKLDRLRLRGINGANDEFLLAATVQNLRRMAMRLCHPPPPDRISVPA